MKRIMQIIKSECFRAQGDDSKCSSKAEGCTIDTTTDSTTSDIPIPKLGGCMLTPLTIDELYEAKEMFSFGGGGIVPIVQLDDRIIGDGTPGPVFRYCYDKLLLDLDNNTDALDRVPYELFEGSGGSR